MGLMSILTGGDLIKEIGTTVRQVIPNPDAQREFDLKIAELADKADERDQELLQGQIEINKVEAGSANLFVSGWRPAIGWVGAAALGWTWMLAPFVNWIATLAGAHIQAPALPAESIYPIVLQLLGIGAMRTFEKMRGVATSVNGTVPKPVLPVASDPVPSSDSHSNNTSKISRWFK